MLLLYINNEQARAYTKYILIFTMVSPEIYEEVTLKLVAYKQKTFIHMLLESRGWRSEPLHSRVLVGTLCELHTDVFSVFSLRVKKAEREPWCLFYSLILYMSAPSSKAISLQSTPSLNPVLMELYVNKRISRGHKHLVNPSFSC